jgi:hypothetical protein
MRMKPQVYSAPLEIQGEQGATASDMAARPAMSGGRIPDTVDRSFYNESDVEEAWRELLACAAELGDRADGFAYDLVAVGRQVLSDRFNAMRGAFAKAAAGASVGGGTIAARSAWHCVHFNISDDDKCKGLTGAKQLSCEAAVCVAKGGNFSHDEHHNDKYPGCGTCWCCSEGAAPPPTPTPPAPPVDIAEVKRIGAGLLELIDDMDRLLGK